MFFRRRKEKVSAYKILIPPLTKAICLLTPDEAQSYFEWYVSVVPQRIQYLSVQCFGQATEENLTPESLIDLWRWFLQKAEIELDKDGKKLQLSLITEYLLRDIGMYLGVVFIKNNTNLYWDYYVEPSDDYFVNTPYIHGFVNLQYSPPFSMIFDPIHMARIQALKMLPYTDITPTENDLYKLYQHWIQFAPKVLETKE